MLISAEQGARTGMMRSSAQQRCYGRWTGRKVAIRTGLKVHGQPWAQSFGRRRLAFYLRAAGPRVLLPSTAADATLRATVN